ncbi:MAG: hypothetical protein WEC54_02830, partial [Gemmatimonadales bacterium]
AVPALAIQGQDGDRTLATVVATCLAQHPRDRYQTADELVAALEQAPEIRGDTPVAVRVFVARSHAVARAAGGLSVLTVVAGYGLVSGIGAGNTSVIAWSTAALVAFIGGPAVALLRTVRRALRGGHTHETMADALDADLHRRRQELAFTQGTDPDARGRVARRVSYIAIGVAAVAAGWIATGLVGANAALLAFALGIPTALVAGVLGHAQARAPRQALAGKLWLRLWDGPFGRGMARLAGVGIPAPALPPARATAPEAPEVMHLMESEIARIRAWLDAPDTLDKALEADAEQAGGQLAAMESLHARLQSAQHDNTNPGNLTADMAAARRVCEMVQLMMGAQM